MFQTILILCSGYDRGGRMPFVVTSQHIAYTYLTSKCLSVICRHLGRTKFRSRFAIYADDDFIKNTRREQVVKEF